MHFLVSKKLKRDAKEPLTKKEKRAKRREAKDVHGVINKLMEMYEKLRRYIIKCALFIYLIIFQQVYHISKRKLFFHTRSNFLSRTILTIVLKSKKCFGHHFSS